MLLPCLNYLFFNFEFYDTTSSGSQAPGNEKSWPREWTVWHKACCLESGDVPEPEVWSASGPVPEEDVDPLLRVQSKSSVVSCV